MRTEAHPTPGRRAEIAWRLCHAGLRFLTVLLCTGPLAALIGHSQTPTHARDVAALDKILAGAEPGQKLVAVGDLIFEVERMKRWRAYLAGSPEPGYSPQLAAAGAVTTWPGGIVYYSFNPNVSAPHRQAFVDAANEWSAWANLQFVARTSQVNYVKINDGGANQTDGNAEVGMCGGMQSMSIGSTCWNRLTLVHETGHTLGLLHEHQRFDRDTYIKINRENITPGSEADFVLLPSLQNKGPYDFDSVMHYARNSFSRNPEALNTIVPQPAYSAYLNTMGDHFDRTLSTLDRAGIAAIYGPPPVRPSSVVTNTNDSGPGSLRTALYFAVDHPGTVVTFAIPKTDPNFHDGVFTIPVTNQLPRLGTGTTIDGTTQIAWTGKTNPAGPEVQLDGAKIPTENNPADGLRIAEANCTVRGLTISGFRRDGICMTGAAATRNTVSGCYIGTNPAGIAAVPNWNSGIEIAGGATNNTIGGVNAAARNVISGNLYNAVVIHDRGTEHNVVEGNYIGLNAAGAAALPNAYPGVAIYDGARANLVGGASAGARNVISGNTVDGVAISGAGTSENAVQGNYIGTNPAGNTPIPNAGRAVDIFGGAASNKIGGTSQGTGNVLSGNGREGVVVSGSGSDGNMILGNYIGTDASGIRPLPNGSAAAPATGVDIFAGAKRTVVGNPGGGRNVISGNTEDGVYIGDVGTSGNLIEGNYIGIGADGTTAMGNGWSGVSIDGGPASNMIGGLTGGRNVIGNNLNFGISIRGGGAIATTDNVVQGNSLGVNAAGLPAGNLYSGIGLTAGARGTQVGGTAEGAANIIAHNKTCGVIVSEAASVENSIRANSIFGNGNFGIYLSNGNHSRPHPVLTSATAGSGIAIVGTLTSLANTSFQIDFFANETADASGFWQGATYLGSVSAMSNRLGGASFSATLAANLPPGNVVSATATDPAGNTSDYSPPITVTLPGAWLNAKFGQPNGQPRR